MARAAPIEAAVMGVATAASVVAAVDDTPAGSAMAVATKAAEVFLLRLPSGWPCLRDTDSVAAGPLALFLLPFGWPGLRFSGTPSPLAPGPPIADMVRIRTGEGREAEEEVNYSLDLERPRHLKRSGAGERAGVMRSTKPTTLVTAPLPSHHTRPQEDNCRSHCQGSWVEPTGRATDARRVTPHDASEKEIIMVAVKVQTMGRYAAAFQASCSMGSNPERASPEEPDAS
jgi:hypothetical protein